MTETAKKKALLDWHVEAGVDETIGDASPMVSSTPASTCQSSNAFFFAVSVIGSI